MKKIILGGAAALVLGGMLAPCAQASNPLVISITADIRSTEPGVNRDGNSDTIAGHIVEGLVAYGEKAEVLPMLAKSIDQSPDGKTYTFTLRDGVKFHNGEPLTSADVLWSWHHYMAPKSGWRCLSEYDGRGAAKVIDVTAPDAHTVVFQLDQPNGLFLTTLARVDCGGTGILQKASVKPDGSWDKPIGTGPFELKEWKRGEYISLAKYKDYASLGGERDGYAGAKRPLVDEVRFIIVPDDSTAKAALQRGNIDVVADLSYSDVAAMQKAPNVAVAYAPMMSLTALLLQTRDPLLSKPEMRQAIAHAIDYAQLAGMVTEGLAKSNNSVVPLASPYYGPTEQQGWKFDPALTRQLLAKAGYHGQELVLMATKRYPQSYDSAVVMQAMLQAAGINARLEVMEWATQLDRYNSGNYQMMSFPYSARLDPALNYDMLTGDKNKEPRKVWDSAEARQLIADASLSTVSKERQEIFDKLHRLFLADVPSIPLYNGLDVVAYRKNIKGYLPWAVNRPRGWEVSKDPD